MNWKNIDMGAILNVLRVVDEKAPTLEKTQPQIIYSDGKEELIITYNKIIGEKE